MHAEATSNIAVFQATIFEASAADVNGKSRLRYKLYYGQPGTHRVQRLVYEPIG